jgi:hypothetical protein
MRLAANQRSATFWSIADQEKMQMLWLQRTAVIVVSLATAGSPTATNARGPDDLPAALRGQWQVVANTIDAKQANGAFKENDLDVLGHRVRITGDAMTWMENRTPTQVSRNNTMIGSCLRATYEGAMPSSGMADVRNDYGVALKRWKIPAAVVVTRHDVICAGEKSTWGPETRDAGEFLSLKSGMLIANWYGGLVLLLKRVPSSSK